MEQNQLERKRPSSFFIARQIVYTSLLTFGGGNAIIATLYQEVVKHRKWLSEDHFFNLVAAANLFPGPSLFKFCILIAYELRGKTALILTALGIMLPIPLIFIALSLGLDSILDPALYQSIGRVLMPVISAMLLQVCSEMLKTVRKRVPILPITGFLGISLVLLMYFQIPTPLFFLSGIAATLLLYRPKKTGEKP